MVLDPRWACLLCSCPQHDWRLAKGHIKKDKGRGKNMLKREAIFLFKNFEWKSGELLAAFALGVHRSKLFVYEL